MKCGQTNVKQQQQKQIKIVCTRWWEITERNYTTEAREKSNGDDWSHSFNCYPLVNIQHKFVESVLTLDAHTAVKVCGFFSGFSRNQADLVCISLSLPLTLLCLDYSALDVFVVCVWLRYSTRLLFTAAHTKHSLLAQQSPKHWLNV